MTIPLRKKGPYLLLFTYNIANVDGRPREKKPCMETLVDSKRGKMKEEGQQRAKAEDDL